MVASDEKEQLVVVFVAREKVMLWKDVATKWKRRVPDAGEGVE